MNIAGKRHEASLLAGIWLHVAFVVTLFFGFVSVACAAECSGLDCAQVSIDNNPVEHSDSKDIDFMMGGSCVFCFSVTAKFPEIYNTQLPTKMVYNPEYFKEKSHFTTLDPPPPRIRYEI